MELLSRDVVDDPHDKRILYSVKLDDGRQVDVMRKLFPNFHNGPLWYVMDPVSADVDQRTVIQFVRENAPKLDVVMPVFARKTAHSFAEITETCYSFEQAKYLADKMWADRRKTEYITFEIRNGKEVLVDYLADTNKEMEGNSK